MKKIFGALILLGLFGLSVSFYTRTYFQVAEVLARAEENSKKIKVVIDPGHGGEDPGGIGVSGVLEKDVNLSVAKLLKSYLEQQDIEVVMTRERDIGLNSETAVNKKKEDLANRIAIIQEEAPDFVLCIHQNIFTEEKYSGAQVFYYKDSVEGASLASFIQNQLIVGADPDNTRVPKSNMNYYMLKNCPVPIVIVECGFLSNAEEEAKLGTTEYQRILAWNIYLGTMQYLNTVDKK